jgi:hypothetical protein
LILPKIRQYPKRIRVRGEPWDIQFVRKIPSNDTHDVGLCDPSNNTIYIKLKQSPRDTFLTFIHEVIHAMEVEWDFNLPHTQKDDVVDKLERAIGEFLENNF